MFRVLLLRRLRLLLLLTRRICRCGRHLDALGHHHAACARAAVLGRQGFALASAAAQVCREASGRVTPHVFLRELDIAAPDFRNNRRLEIVADALLVFGLGQNFGVSFARRRFPSPWYSSPQCQTQEGADLPGVPSPREQMQVRGSRHGSGRPLLPGVFDIHSPSGEGESPQRAQRVEEAD